MRERVLIKGAGDLASGTAQRLFRCGYRVAMTELEQPTAVRRTVAFSSAIERGTCEVEGVRGVRHELERAHELESFDWSHVPVFVDPRCALRERFAPDAIVDGRTLKRNLDNRVADARLVIGFGPGLVAGQDVHFVIETQRGHDLGRIIARGTAAADTGTPGMIGGFSVERILRAPVDGTLRTERAIGDLVRAGERVGEVAGQALVARIDGVIRGLLPDGAQVTVGQKTGDVDPRADRAACFTLSDKARTISGAALEILVSFFEAR